MASPRILQDTVVSYFTAYGLEAFMDQIGAGSNQALFDVLNTIITKLDQLLDGQKIMLEKLTDLSRQIEFDVALLQSNQVETDFRLWFSRLKALNPAMMATQAGKDESASIIHAVKENCIQHLGTYHSYLTDSRHSGSSRPIITIWLDKNYEALVKSNGKATMQNLYNRVLPSYLLYLETVQRNGLAILGMVYSTAPGAEGELHRKYTTIVEQNIKDQRLKALEHHVFQSYAYFKSILANDENVYLQAATSENADYLTGYVISDVNVKKIRLSNPADHRDNRRWKLKMVHRANNSSGSMPGTCSLFMMNMVDDRTFVETNKRLLSVDNYGYCTYQAEADGSYLAPALEVVLRFIPDITSGKQNAYKVYEVFENNETRLFEGFEYADANCVYTLRVATSMSPMEEVFNWANKAFNNLFQHLQKVMAEELDQMIEDVQELTTTEFHVGS